MTMNAYGLSTSIMPNNDSEWMVELDDVEFFIIERSVQRLSVTLCTHCIRHIEYTLSLGFLD